MALTRANEALSKNGIRSVTGTYTAKQNDDLLLLSGASFTLTLPSAATVPGKVFKIIHNGTSLSQVYTLATTSSQTIGGVAGGSYALYTNSEFLEIVSDGSNYLIGRHRAVTDWSTPVALTFTAGTSGTFTKGNGGTPARADYIKYRRDGKFAEIEFDYGHTTAGSNGVGNLKLSFPANLAPNTTETQVYTGTDATDSFSRHLNSNVKGNSATTNSIMGKAFVVDSSFFCVSWIIAAGAVGIWGSASMGLTNATTNMGGWLRIPVSGWQP